MFTAPAMAQAKSNRTILFSAKAHSLLLLLLILWSRWRGISSRILAYGASTMISHIGLTLCYYHAVDRFEVGIHQNHLVRHVGFLSWSGGRKSNPGFRLGKPMF